MQTQMLISFVFCGSQNTIKANKFGEFCSDQAAIFCWMKRLVVAQIQARLTETEDHWSLKATWLLVQRSFNVQIEDHATIGFCSQQ